MNDPLREAALALVDADREGPRPDEAPTRFALRMADLIEDLRAALAAPPPEAGLREALDNAYRERNAVVAALIRTNGWRASLVPIWRSVPKALSAADGWWIVYAETPQGQVSWHISPVDIRLFDGIPVEHVQWDGHTTDEKYERLATLAVSPADPEAPNE